MNDKTLDCSDLDNHLGKPITPTAPREPISATDIRRWAQAMHYPNLLHYDHDYAAVSRFGRLVAPQSFAIAAADGHGCTAAAVGHIPNSHLVFGGDEWWFDDTPLFPGDRMSHEKIPFDYVVKETGFAGPTCFQRGDNFYYNQLGDRIAKQRSTSIRYNRDYAVEMGAMADDKEPDWTDEELEDIENRKLEYIDMLQALGHDKRWWDDVNAGDKLPARVFGPHSVASFATEWRAYLFTTWGAYHRATDINSAALGFTKEMSGPELDPVVEKYNPETTDGAYIGPSRGHLNPRWAQFIGMPRSYGYGASMGAWILDYFAGWAGEWGRIVHSNCQYRGPAFTGDITVMTGEVIDKMVDDEGRNLVQLDCKMANQSGKTMATAKAELELPRR